MFESGVLAKLLETGGKYRLAFEKMTEAFCLVQLLIDNDGNPVDYKVHDINPAFEKLTRLTRPIVVGKKGSSFMFDVEGVWLKRYKQVSLSKQPLRFEEYEPRIKKWLDIKVFPLQEDNLFAVLFDDITERKIAVAAHEENMEKYRTLFEVIDEGFCIVEPILDAQGKTLDCKIIETNPMFSKQTGLTRLEGRYLKEVFPNIDQRWFEVYGTVVTTGESVRSVILDKGTNRWFDVGVFKLRGLEGKRVAALIRDVTRRRGNLDKLNYQNQVLQAINQVYMKAIASDTMGEFGQECLKIMEAVTESTCSFIGEIHEDTLNPIAFSDPYWYKCASIFKADDCQQHGRSPIRGLLGKVAQGGRSIMLNKPCPCPEIEGGTKLLSFLGVPIIREGMVTGIICVGNREGGYKIIHQEILEALAPTILETMLRKGVEDALRKSKEGYQALVEELNTIDRHKNEFLGLLSHELRNPLASIMLALSLIDRGPSSGNLKMPLEIIRRQTAQLTRLIDDLLDMTRINSGKISLQTEHLDLREIVMRVYNDYQVRFADKGVGLEVNLPDSPVIVDADEARLIQVVENLIHNALKYTPEGGNTVLSVWNDEAMGETMLEVVDTGIGIDPDMATTLFQPFFQANSSLDRNGLGLGLSLVKSLLEMHGGSIKAISEGLGSGAKFILRLPLSKGGLIVKGEEAETINAKLKILVIEDNPDVALLLTTLLQHLGHEVVATYEGLEGINRAREDIPDVVLCDIGLPGLNGYDVAKNFRGDESLQDVFLIALTGYAQPEDRELALRAGFNEHLAKPINLEVLNNTLEQVIRNSKKSAS